MEEGRHRSDRRCSRARNPSAAESFTTSGDRRALPLRPPSRRRPIKVMLIAIGKSANDVRMTTKPIIAAPKWSRLSEQDFRFEVGHLPGLSCRAEGQQHEVSLIGCHAVKARIRRSSQAPTRSDELSLTGTLSSAASTHLFSKKITTNIYKAGNFEATRRISDAARHLTRTVTVHMRPLCRVWAFITEF